MEKSKRKKRQLCKEKSTQLTLIVFNYQVLPSQHQKYEEVKGFFKNTICFYVESQHVGTEFVKA